MDNKYYVYKYYINDQLLYVGRTNNFIERFKQHLRENSEYDKVTRIDIATFDSDGDMMLYEKYYITKFHPPLNKKDTQFSKPSFELPEPEWISYTREEFNALHNSTTSINKNRIDIKIKSPEIILPDNTVNIPKNIPISWFKQFDMNTQIFNYNQEYTLHFETPYDEAKPAKQTEMYSWDKNTIINYWCSIIEEKLDRIPYIEAYPYDAPILNLTIKRNNYDVMYSSLQWFQIILDKSQGCYLVGTFHEHSVIDQNGIFHIEELIQECEKQILETFSLVNTPSALSALNEALGLGEYDVSCIKGWQPLYITYKNNKIDIAVIKVTFLSDGYDSNFICNLLIINQSTISYSDHMTILEKYIPCGVLRRFGKTFKRDKRFEYLLIDNFQNSCYNK